MNATQAFLLELSVIRLGIREKPKVKTRTVGFEGDRDQMNPESSQIAVESSSKTLAAESSTSVKFKRLHPFNVGLTIPRFEPVFIQEDLNPSHFGMDDAIDERGGDEMAREIEERKLARIAGLSYREYQDSKMKDPNLMNERRFKRGRTTLFRTTPTDMLSLLKSGRVNINVFSEGNLDLGTASVEFPPSFAESVIVAAYSSAMREQMSRVGPIWWPPQFYRKQMFKDVREAQKREREQKEREKSTKDDDLNVRFKNLCDLEPLPKECKICSQMGDPCNPITLTAEDMLCCGENKCCGRRAVKSNKRNRLEKINRNGNAWLMYPSPDPIQPPALPSIAETTEVCDIVNDKRTQTAVLSIKMKLSCFGTTLEINSSDREEQFP